jgi:hypothetical protein
VGKWSKHQHLVQDERLQEYLPETTLFTPETLWEYTAKYKTVILKPSGGGGGVGIIQVTSLGDDRYSVHAGSSTLSVEGKANTVSYVRSLFRPKPYLIQPRIRLGRIEGRPFDVRIMVQRRKGQPWKVTGWLVKLAGPGFVVTNIARSRGKVLPLETAFRLSDIHETPDLLQKLREVALTAADRLGTVYPGLRMIGLDMGIDVNGKPWIIEANFRPALSLFQKLPDRRCYRRIVSHMGR